MNELYGNEDKKKKSSKRRWIYLASAMVVLVVLLLLPQAQTVRLSLVVVQNDPPEMILTLPKDCLLEKVYLRGNEHVPGQGKLFVLQVNGKKFTLSDFKNMPEADAEKEAGYENRLPDVPWKDLFEQRTIKVLCSEVNPAVARYDLELVFEVSGAPDTVKKWHEFVKLRAIDNKLPEKSTNSK